MMKMMIESLLALLVAQSGPPADPDAVAMWIDDLGRLTPFGRTFDVYIQTGFDPEFSYPNGDPRRPYMIGSTRGNESPTQSFSWAIDGDIFKNHNDSTYPFLDNCQECIEYYENFTTFDDWVLPDGTVIPCSEPGTYWDCIQANPYQRTRYLGAKFTPVNWEFVSCCPNQGDLVDLEYAWCDSWILHGPLGKKYGAATPQYNYPMVQQQHKDLMTPHYSEGRVIKFWSHREDIVGERCCSAPSQNDYGDLIRWSADVDWMSEKWPGSFHIARFTGPHSFTSSGVVRFACGNDHPCDPSPYQVCYYADNSCPSDLNEDGVVGFQDLLQVLGDVAGFRYHYQTSNGFNAIVKVLSEWGACP
jgi:hypothetical protein